MSPLFHKADDGPQADAGKHDRLPTLFGLGPQLDEVANSAAALPLEEFAAQLMERCFSPEALADLASFDVPTSYDVEAICVNLLPNNSGERASEPIPDAYQALENVVIEAVQLLQNAGLVMHGLYKPDTTGSRNLWRNGLVPTRRALAAMANGTVRQILSHTYAS
jgi:hypothetical protein